LFEDSDGGFFQTVESAGLLFRKKDERDYVIPSGNSIAAWNAFRLGEIRELSDLK